MSATEITNSYKRYLLLEKGLSKNSIEAYMRDLQKLLDFAEEEKLSLKTIKLSDIEALLAEQYDKEISPRSLSRIISGLKSFFRFMVLNGYRDDNPTELLESPKIGLKLPHVLSIEDIDKILSVIDVSTSEGTRNYADRKSTRLNSSHVRTSYAVFCLKKKN